MKKIMKLSIFILIAMFIAADYGDMQAATKKDLKKGKDSRDEILRDYLRYYDLQKNTVSNIEFYTTNYGIFGLDVARGVGGGYWPRGSENQYIFGGGIWFGARKRQFDTSTYKRKYVLVTYNPNNGRSWMVPGHIAADDQDVADPSDIMKYRTYFSTDFRSDGTPIQEDEEYNWPIWDASPDPTDTLKKNRYFGWFIPDVNDRNTNTFPDGPAFISGEDIFAAFKDTDLNQYDDGFAIRQDQGYPLRLQFEHTIYSWGFGRYKDFIFLRYDIINFSEDTLEDCWIAPVMDVDIATQRSSRLGAVNDKVKYYDEDPSLNLALQWSETDRGEAGRGFGYLGFDFLESPATIRDYDENGNLIISDSTHFIRHDKAFYKNEEQLGLVTFRNWSIEEDLHEDAVRYDYISSRQKDGESEAGDKRFMMATGQFHMRPGDTARVIVCILVANPAIKEEPDGSVEDLKNLVDLDKFAQSVYDQGFRAPSPPDRAIFHDYTPLNNSLRVSWDSTSEWSDDRLERGLDFMGYKLYRARNADLDTFNVDNITPNEEYKKGAGPFGWKQIAQWEIPTPYRKSVNRAGTNPDDQSLPMIDSLRIMGPVYKQNGEIDTFAIRIARIPKGVNLFASPLDSLMNVANRSEYALTPVVFYADTSIMAQPWGPYYDSIIDSTDLETYEFTTQDGQTVEYSGLFFDKNNQHPLYDDIMVGVLRLNRAKLAYNPLFYRYETTTISQQEFDNLPEDGVVLVAVDSTTRIDTIPDTDPPEFDTVTVYFNVVDEVYMKSTAKSIGGNEYAIDRFVSRNFNTIMRDRGHLNLVLDSLYSYIQQGLINISISDWPDFENTDEARTIIENYMIDVTGNREFLDIGDDNNDFIINTSQATDDPTKSERLLNNISYYYKLQAYDEGDFFQPTPEKLNGASEGNTNWQETIPKNSPVGRESDIEVIYVDSSRIGGLYNFNFYPIDTERLTMLYSGDTLELSFEPFWQLNTLSLVDAGEKEFGLYSRQMKLTNITKGIEIYNGLTYFEPRPCNLSYRGLFTENAFSYVFSDTAIVDTISNDTIRFGTPYNDEIITRSGEFTTGDYKEAGYCYQANFTNEGRGVLGFGFDFTMQQYGGRYRPDSTTGIINSDAVTPVTFITADLDPRGGATEQTIRRKIYTTQPVSIRYIQNDISNFSAGFLYGSFNNGPVNLELTFNQGGTEEMTVEYGNGQQQTFNVPYLTVDVKNVLNYNRPREDNAFDSIPVNYNVPWEHIQLGPFMEPIVQDQQPIYQPTPLSLGAESNKFINKYNLSSTGFVNARGRVNAIRLRQQFAKPLSGPFANEDIDYPTVGTQGRYYLTGFSADMQDTIDFVNVITAAGVQFVFDFANRGRRSGIPPEWGDQAIGQPVDPDVYDYSEDFEPGDKVMLKTTGGTLGLPLPGAKVRAVVKEAPQDDKNITDKVMDEIMVVPNPYYITHQGEKSSYDAQIYFTKLPKECTIEIYTVTGDLVRTLEHNEGQTGTDQKYVEVWDLLTRNQQRVESQTFLAVIRTPDGSNTVKPFTVVVGGFRIISGDE